MAVTVGVRELRQNLSKYLARVKAGEDFVVTERGQPVGRLIPNASDGYGYYASRYGATIPVGRLEETAAAFTHPPAPDGTTDAFLAESRDR